MIQAAFDLYPELYCLSLATLIVLGLFLWNKLFHQQMNGF